MKKAQEAVIKTIERMTNALGEGDIEGIMATYEYGANIVFSPELTVTQSEMQQKGFSELIATNPQFTYSKGHEVFIAEDIALHIAPWNMTGQADDGTEFSDTGLSVAVLRRQADDKWLIVIDNPYGTNLADS
jgi:ketosteroid isomerase-like protein